MLCKNMYSEVLLHADRVRSFGIVLFVDGFQNIS